MADIFLSYKSSDRPRAEKLREWFEGVGWSVWIDRKIDVGEGWEAVIDRELSAARLVVVLWGAEARRSEWVQREAAIALEDGRLLQIHATGLPLMPPFDDIQAVQMQAWSGEAAHTARKGLLAAVAKRLGTDLTEIPEMSNDIPPPMVRHELIEILQLAFYYCARQLERRRHDRDGEKNEQDWNEIRDSFDGLLYRLKEYNSADGDVDDREGTLHMIVKDFLDQLNLLVPDHGVVS